MEQRKDACDAVRSLLGGDRSAPADRLVVSHGVGARLGEILQAREGKGCPEECRLTGVRRARACVGGKVRVVAREQGDGSHVKALSRRKAMRRRDLHSLGLWGLENRGVVKGVNLGVHRPGDAVDGVEVWPCAVELTEVEVGPADDRLVPERHSYTGEEFA